MQLLLLRVCAGPRNSRNYRCRIEGAQGVGGRQVYVSKQHACTYLMSLISVLMGCPVLFRVYIAESVLGSGFAS